MCDPVLAVSWIGCLVLLFLIYIVVIVLRGFFHLIGWFIEEFIREPIDAKRRQERSQKKRSQKKRSAQRDPDQKTTHSSDEKRPSSPSNS